MQKRELDKLTVTNTHSAVTNEPIAYAVINGLMFNLTWFAIVATESAVAAPFLAALHLLVHFAAMGKGFVELKVVFQVTLIGIALDQLLFYLNIFNVGGVPTLPPLWLSCLWPVLATTFMHAFAGLQGRCVLASIVGGAGGALSFVAGTGLTNVAFESQVYGPVIIGLLWAVLFPLLLQIPRLNGYQVSASHV